MTDLVFAPIPTNTQRMTVTTSSARMALPGQNSGNNIRIFNGGSAIAYVEFGTVAVNAVVPTAGSTVGSMPIGNGVTEVFAIGRECTYLAAITGASTADLYFTLGSGV